MDQASEVALVPGLLYRYLAAILLDNDSDKGVLGMPQRTTSAPHATESLFSFDASQLGAWWLAGVALSSS